MVKSPLVDPFYRKHVCNKMQNSYFLKMFCFLLFSKYKVTLKQTSHFPSNHCYWKLIPKFLKYLWNPRDNEPTRAMVPAWRTMLSPSSSSSFSSLSSSSIRTCIGLPVAWRYCIATIDRKRTVVQERELGCMLKYQVFYFGFPLNVHFRTNSGFVSVHRCR